MTGTARRPAACCASPQQGFGQRSSERSDGGDSPSAPQELSLEQQAERLLKQPPGDQQADFTNTLLETARAMARQNQWESSLQLLLKALAHHPQVNSPPERQLRRKIRTGIISAAWQLDRHDLVIREADALLESIEPADDPAARSAAQHLLTRSLLRNGQLQRALEEIGQLASLGAASRAVAADQTLALGSAALKASHAKLAMQAYRQYVDLQPQGDRRADAELGIAWAAAAGALPPRQAEQLLAEFMTAYPDHRDARRAGQRRADLLDQLGDTASATELRLDSLGEGPDGQLVATSPDQYARLLVGAFAHSDDRHWQAAVAAMVGNDDDGDLTFQVLQRLASSGEQRPAEEPREGAADAPPTSYEHLAEHLTLDLLGMIVESAEHSEPRPACHAACRWAGSTGRWSMLSLVADQLEPPAKAMATNRSAAIDRLLAESLMQTRRGHEALAWWQAILQTWDVDDFATLIRAAETAVAAGTLELARRRVKAAAAAAEDGFDEALVGMLEAELEIRRGRLDDARGQLEQITRGTGTPAALRPRAQWLIGESYFMQQRYGDAIDAYRRVEALDADGQWAAAALVQAGKSFEYLARPREAAVCYTALLSRFADTPHAQAARSRLARLGETSTLR